MFDFQTWDIGADEGLMSKDSLAPHDLEQLGNTAYHEGRHTEQWHSIARNKIAELNAGKPLLKRLLPNKAERGQQVRDVAGKLGVPEDVVAHAHTPWKRATYFGKNRRFAEAMHESVYGQGAASRSTTIRSLEPHGEAVRRAKAVRDGLLIDPQATQAQKAAAEVALEQARQTYNATYKAYRKLPEENDAWQAGDAVGSRIKDGQATHEPAPGTATEAGEASSHGAPPHITEPQALAGGDDLTPGEMTTARPMATMPLSEKEMQEISTDTPAAKTGEDSDTLRTTIRTPQPEVPTLPEDSIKTSSEISQANYERAIKAKESLPKTAEYRTKVTSSTTKSDFMSGTGSKSAPLPNGFRRTSVADVLEYAKKIGHKVPENKALDNGVPGSHYASHAEVQGLVSDTGDTMGIPGQPTGVSENMCGSCQEFFRRDAVHGEASRYNTDPTGTWDFKPGGTVLRPDGEVIQVDDLIKPSGTVQRADESILKLIPRKRE